jgi:hypothetical protein
MNAQPIPKAWATPVAEPPPVTVIFRAGTRVLRPQLRELLSADLFVDRRLRPSAAWQLSVRSFSSWRDRSRIE